MYDDELLCMTTMMCMTMTMMCMMCMMTTVVVVAVTEVALVSSACDTLNAIVNVVSTSHYHDHAPNHAFNYRRCNTIPTHKLQYTG